MRNLKKGDPPRVTEPVISPREFMKARRPHLFSDSKVEQEPFLSKNDFDNLLTDITARQDETRFEHFCRHLAKKEICPNLIPHTGPTGGGDGKTDSETYPVSPQIASLWYVGDPGLASQERWAFAFSAMKKWKPKATTDISKIVATGRNYTRIYCITNQYVSSKKRAEFQDEQKAIHGIEVHLFDKSWLIEKVVENKRWEIVCLCFDLNDRKLVEKLGPQDHGKRQELTELEATLEKAVFRGAQFAEDCLEAALIARNLELPKVDVLGRFERARRAATQTGDDVQTFRIIYKWAWTEYWWYQDLNEFKRLYVDAEKLINTNKSAFVLEDLVNLCQVGLGYSRSQEDGQEAVFWVDRAKFIESLLEGIVKESGKSGNGYWAQTLTLNLQLAAAAKSDSITRYSKSLMALLEKAKRVTEYPIQAAIQIIEELSGLVLENEAFDELFEFCMKLKAERVSEINLGLSRLRRGYQLLTTDKVYQAIAQSSKAQALLAKEEETESFLAAIVCTGLAYRKSGLLWASRANCVLSAAHLLRSRSKKGLPVSAHAVMFIQEAIDAELELGRVLIALQWLELLHLASIDSPVTDEELAAHQRADFRIARFILESNLNELQELVFLPSVLKMLGMRLASISFLFAVGELVTANEELNALGQAEELPSLDSLVEQIVSATDTMFGEEWLPKWYISNSFCLRSKILGCDISLEGDGSFELLLGETILGFTEALFSTAIMLNSCMAACPELHFAIRKTSSEDGKVTVEEDECGESTIVFEHPFTDSTDFDLQRLQKLLCESIPLMMKELYIGISQKDLEELFAEHSAFERAVLNTSSSTAFLNVFDESFKYNKEKWMELLKDGPPQIRATRTIHWKEGMTKEAAVDKVKRPSMHVKTDVSDIKIRENLKHSDMSVGKVINLPLWDKAKWRGLGFLIEPTELTRLDLLLLFANEDAGKKIFRGWRRKIGKEDSEELLGLTVIRGIDRKNPAWYRLVFSVGEEYLQRAPELKGSLFLASRMNDQLPSDTINLDRFLQSYNKAGWYSLLPGKLDPSRGIREFDEDLSIKKRTLRVVEAWTIGPEDPLCLNLEGIADPVVPADVRNPPILQALKQQRYQIREAKARRNANPRKLI